MSKVILKLTAVPLLFLVACNGGGGQEIPGPVVGEPPVTAYLPYVEDVVVPEEVFVNEVFEIELKLSSASNPDILTGEQLAERWIPDKFSEQDGDGHSGWAIQPWLLDGPMFSSVPNDTLTIRLSYFSTGDRLLRLYSADTRENGGKSGLYQLGPPITSTPRVDFYAFTDYIINVVERPEEATE